MQPAHDGGKVVRPTQPLPLPPGKIPGTHFCYMMSLPQGHSAARTIRSQRPHRESNPRRPACSAVPQPKRSTSWKTNSCSVGQYIYCMIWSRKVHYRARNSSHPFPCQANAFHKLQFYTSGVQIYSAAPRCGELAVGFLPGVNAGDLIANRYKTTH